MAFDAQAAWVRLGALVARQPNWGRQRLLSEMARIAEECMVPEDEMDRALRLVLPELADVIFNRAQSREPQVPDSPVADEESDWVGHTGQAPPSMAAR